MATFIYKADDAPQYRVGNRNLIIINILSIILFIFTKVYYVLKNRSRDKRWAAMTPEVLVSTIPRIRFCADNSLGAI
jgi:hypothetical protein